MRFDSVSKFRCRAVSRCVLCVTAAVFLLVCSARMTQAAEIPVTSAFGWRYHPITGVWSFHSGIDLGYAAGTPVSALFDGIVAQAGDYGDGYGNQVLLYHPEIDAYTRYAHMSEVDVTVDQYVPQGGILGLVGATGRATGPHLHLEYIVRDSSGAYTYVDPLILWP